MSKCAHLVLAIVACTSALVTRLQTVLRMCADDVALRQHENVTVPSGNGLPHKYRLWRSTTHKRCNGLTVPSCNGLVMHAQMMSHYGTEVCDSSFGNGLVDQWRQKGTDCCEANRGLEESSAIRCHLMHQVGERATIL